MVDYTQDMAKELKIAFYIRVVVSKHMKRVKLKTTFSELFLLPGTCHSICWKLCQRTEDRTLLPFTNSECRDTSSHLPLTALRDCGDDDDNHHCGDDFET